MTLIDALLGSYEIDGDLDVICWKDQSGGFTHRRRRSEFFCLIDSFASWCGRELGDSPVTGILLANRPEWHIADFGTMAARGTTVGFYLEEKLDYHLHKIETSKVNLLVTEEEFCLRHGEEILASCPTVERILYCSERALDDRQPALLATDKIRPFSEALSAPGSVGGLKRRAEGLSKDDIVRHVYTSGTSGLPKAVPLSHWNLLVNANDYAERLRLTRGHHRYPSYLPISHVYETGVGLSAFLRGGTVFYSDKRHLREDLPRIRPTAFASVPKVYHRVQKGLSESLPAPMRWLISNEWMPDFVKSPIRKLVLRKIGLDACTLWLASGARLPAETFSFYKDVLGVELLSAYGLSETAGGVFMSAPGFARPGSVGTPLKSIRCKLAEDGEILLEGDAVFEGYLDHPRARDEDGYFHTGDLAVYRNGEYFLEGRRSSIVKTATGKYVNQESIAERLVSECSFVQQAAVFAEGRDDPVALVTLGDEPGVLQGLADRHGWSFTDTDRFVREPSVIQKVEEELTGYSARIRNESVAPAFKLRHFLYCLPFTTENDLATPSLKVKYTEISRRYRAEIDDFPVDDSEDRVVFEVAEEVQEPGRA